MVLAWSASSSPPASRTILLADDEPLLRQLVRRALAPLPYRLVEAADGLEAIAVAQQEQPALILLDLTMPQLDGWGVLRALQADPTLQAIPVVIVTGDAAVDEAMAVSAGAVGLIRKPFQIAPLRATVQAVLGVA